MITIFCLPKPFRGAIGTIQRNALRSWLALEPAPEVILLGDEEGTAETAAEHRVRHIPEIERSEFGTPLVSSLFRQAREEATNPWLCYINSDIILLDNFPEAFRRVREAFPDGRFLLTGLRWNLDVGEEIDFADPVRAAAFLRDVRARASIDHVGLDYFVFPRESFREVKPFAVGRSFLDAWFLYRARSEGLRLVDGTPAVTAVHQNHGSVIGAGGARKVYHLFRDNPEIRRNHDLCGLYPRTFSFLDARYVLTEGGDLVRKSWLRRLKGSLLSTLSVVAYDVLYPLYPYSHPLLRLGSAVSNRLLVRRWIVK